MNRYSSHLVNGEWCPSTDAATTPVFESFSGVQSGAVSHADGVLVDKAVNAARAAFRNWSLAAVSRRAGYVRAVADALAARSEEIAAGISREVGMPLKLSRRIQVDAPAAAWRAAADIGEQMAFTENVGNSLVSLEPAGVVAAITPWNYPLHQITGKLAAALMAGCTVVLKPSELAPSAAAALGDAILAAGLPPGVVNIVMGGAAVGQMLVDHPGVDMVSFTGSTAVGRRIAASAGAALKRVSLELGGKSPGIAMEDADPQMVVKNVVGACFLNSGQTCSAITRLLVPESQYETYRPLLASAVGAMALGSAFDAATRVGPLISAQQKKRVLEFITEAEAAGFDLIAGGSAAPVPDTGFFVAPTVFGRVPAAARLAREEVFGPVLAVSTYRSLDEAVEMANGTGYGLAAAVWSRSDDSALGVARRIRAGQVDVNGAPFNARAPFGGFGLSGIGREGGRYGIEEFLEPRSIQMPR